MNKAKLATALNHMTLGADRLHEVERGDTHYRAAKHLLRTLTTTMSVGLVTPYEALLRSQLDEYIERLREHEQTDTFIVRADAPIGADIPPEPKG